MSGYWSHDGPVPSQAPTTPKLSGNFTTNEYGHVTLTRPGFADRLLEFLEAIRLIDADAEPCHYPVQRCATHGHTYPCPWQTLREHVT